MKCELCSTDGQGGETRCSRCGFDTTLPSDVRRFLTSMIGFRPGELLEGRYRIDRILGFGGMSVVYKARDEMLGEDVAIKVINGVRVADDVKLFSDLKRDIVTTRKLAHPDIVKVHDFHKADTCGFLTMEFVRGQDLASLIAERGRLEEGDVCRLAIQVAEALNYAHANGVVHCDIKPGNLLLTETGRVKIADFGISRVMQEESTGLTGLVVGTPGYMSPEQIRGERPTPLTDMYALGIVMWHCLMGGPPYTKGDIAYQHVHVPLPPMDGVSPELEAIVRRAAGKAMADRYPDLDVMARELRQFLQRQGEATVMQTPPPRPAAPIMLTPPPRPAATIMLTPPPRPAGPSMITPPPQQAAPSAQTPAPRPVDTAVQTPTPPAADSLMRTPLPLSADSIMRTPPPQPLSAAATSGGEALAEAGLADGGPADGSPTTRGPGGMAQPSPAPPPAAAKTNTALVVVVALLLAGAALWALLPSSPPTGPAGGETPLVGKDLASGGGVGTVVDSPAAGGRLGGAVSVQGTAPDKPAQPVIAGTPATKSPPAAQQSAPPGQQSAPAGQQDASPVARDKPPVAECKESACFEIFDAELTPAVARPGQTVRCTARYSFRHDEGGNEPLEVEESAKPGIRFTRGASRRVEAGQHTNLFEVSFTVPDRAKAGTYPVTLSVRRRRITESVELQLVVTK